MKSQEDSDLNLESKNHFKSLFKIIGLLKYGRDVHIKSRIFFSFCFLVLAKLINISIPVIYKYTVDALSGETNLKISLGVFFVPTVLIVFYGLARVLSNVFAEMRDFVFVHVNQFVQREIALKTFTHLHNLSLSFHLERQTGGLSRVIERGIHGVQFVLTFLIFNVLPTLLEIFMVACVLMWQFESFFAIVILLTIGSYISFTLVATEWRLKFRQLMNAKDTEANTKAIDSLLNYETVKYFGNEKHEMTRFDESLQVYRSAAIKNQQSLSLLNVGQSVIIGTGLVLLMWKAASSVQSGVMTLGDFVMINSYLIQLYLPLGFLGFVYREIKRGLVNMDQLFQLLEVDQSISDPKEPADIATVYGKDIVFDHVSFSYNDDRKIINDLSFTIERGKTLAVVGPSGSGKSTLARLLFRFYDVSKGEIKLGNQNIKQFNQSDLRSLFAVVPQDTVLFNETIEYNIRYGKLDASEFQWKQAAKFAEIDNFIRSLPKSYETQVGERGLKLSGGEKQRVAIARAVLKDPEVFIFDEASSALDTQTEKAIQDSLKKVSRGKTTLIIAHRLSTIMDADQILVLEKGRAIEQGTHSELMEKRGKYFAMWKAQEQ